MTLVQTVLLCSELYLPKVIWFCGHRGDIRKGHAYMGKVLSGESMAPREKPTLGKKVNVAGDEVAPGQTRFLRKTNTKPMLFL